VASLQNEYWREHFILFDSWQAFFRSWGQNFDNLMSRWFCEMPKWIRGVSRVFIPLCLIPPLLMSWSVFKKDRFLLHSVSSIALVIFLEHLLFGMLHKYPFVVIRTSLFRLIILFDYVSGFI
jgi:hypothetical protein